MAIASVNEIWSGRMGGIDGKYVRRYVRIWRVVSTEREDGPLEITATALLPALYSTYENITGTETDVGATLRSLDARQDSENPFVWEVVGEYSSDDIPIPSRESPVGRAGTGTNRGDSVEASPLELIPEVQFGVQKFQRPQDYYYTSGTSSVAGTLHNSAGQRFDPATQVDDSRFTLTITRHEPVNPTDLAIVYTDTINNASWKVMSHTFPAFSVKCDGISGASMFHQNLFFWKVTYAFMIRKPALHPVAGAGSYPGWNEVYLDAGYYENDGTDFIEIFDKFGHTMSAPSPLDGAGLKLDAALALAGQFAWTTDRQLYPAKNFSVFGFPEDFP